METYRVEKRALAVESLLPLKRICVSGAALVFLETGIDISSKWSSNRSDAFAEKAPPRIIKRPLVRPIATNLLCNPLNRNA